MNKAQSRAWNEGEERGEKQVGKECGKCGEKRAGEECGKWGVAEGAERLASRGKAKKVKKRLKFERICVICPRFCALCTNAGSCIGIILILAP